MNFSKSEAGKRLKLCRKRLHYTQVKMAAELNISVKHYSEAERGIIGFSVDNWIKAASILGVSLDYLLTGIDIKYPVPAELVEMYSLCPDEKKPLLLEMVRMETELLKS